jgi:hypothetical protein
MRSAVVKRGGAAGSCEAVADAGACLLDATGTDLPAGAAGVEHPLQIASNAVEMQTQNAVESGVTLFMGRAFAPL